MTISNSQVRAQRTTNFAMESFDLTSNLKPLYDFMKHVNGLFQNDFPDFYEFELNQIKEEMNVKHNQEWSLVMTGNAIPFDSSHSRSRLKIDWNEKIEHILDKVRICNYYFNHFPVARLRVC